MRKNVKKALTHSFEIFCVLLPLAFFLVINGTKTTIEAITRPEQENLFLLSDEGLSRDYNLRQTDILNISSFTTAVKSEEQANQEEQSSASSVYVSLDEAAAKEEIARRESGGSYTAQNGRFYGRYQLDLAYLNGDLSPENQERVADAYVAGRYGSWGAALAHSYAYGWY